MIGAEDSLPTPGRVNSGPSPSNSSGNRATSTKRILLLEDELLVAEMLAYVLVEEGYIVDRATTQAEAERRLALAQYDLVIADWRLPDGDGTVIADMAAHLGSKTF